MNMVKFLRNHDYETAVVTIYLKDEMLMNDNETKKSGGPSAGRVIGIIVLLAAVFGIMVLLLNIVKISYPMTDTTPTEVVEETANTEEDTEDTAEQQEETAEETETEETAEDAAETETSAYQETAPEAEDGSGQAGLAVMGENIMYLASEDGWYRDELNAWYSPDNVHYYYNGWVTLGDKIYHFDAAGMVDRGWKTIGGVEYYFDETGIYNPDAVHEAE